MTVDQYGNPTDDELVVATPELVTFDYQIAGPGSRFLAQLIDFPLQVAVVLLFVFGALALYAATGNGNLALISGLVLGFLAVWGYYPICESLWSGQTLGKRLFGLRVVGDRGEPLRISQSLIRNLLRLLDFLPFFYGIGIIALFVNGRGKRLGDLAAGTVVVREKAGVKLSQLVGAELAPAAVPVQTSLAPAESALVRGLDPDFRRFLVAYADRRPKLDAWRRYVLAGRLEPTLRRHLPELAASAGPVAALDRLADLAASQPDRQEDQRSGV